MNDKHSKPPYASYRSFGSLMNELREHDVMPAAIDRSLLRRRSGSEQSALIATLKWFKLIDDAGIPTKLLEDYIAGNEDDVKVLLKDMVVTAYGQITDGTFNLRSATTSQLADQFRQYDIGGSTLAKSITFFLSAAKDAGMVVSPHAKAPSIVGSSSNKRRAKPALAATAPPAAPLAPAAHRPPPSPSEGMISIPIPIFGGKNGAITLPDSMTEKQWNSVVKMTQYILENYRETMGEEAMPSQAEEDDGL